MLTTGPKRGDQTFENQQQEQPPRYGFNTGTTLFDRHWISGWWKPLRSAVQLSWLRTLALAAGQDTAGHCFRHEIPPWAETMYFASRRSSFWSETHCWPAVNIAVLLSFLEGHRATETSDTPKVGSHWNRDTGCMIGSSSPPFAASPRNLSISPPSRFQDKGVARWNPHLILSYLFSPYHIHSHMLKTWTLIPSCLPSSFKLYCTQLC